MQYSIDELTVGKLEYGSGASAVPYDNQTRYVRITDIDDEGMLNPTCVSPSEVEEDYILNDGDVLFARTGATVGKTYIYRSSDGRCQYAGYLIRAIPNRDLIRPDYLWLFTKSPRYWRFVKQSMKVVAQPNINAKQYGSLMLNLPSLTEQDKLIQLSSHLLNIICSRKNQLERLDLLIKARFVEMFGNPESSEKYPKIAIKDFTNVVSGGTPDRKNNAYWDNGTVPWVKTTELHNNSITNVEEYITEKGLNESSAKIVPADTVLIAMYGQGKTRGMTAILEIPASTNQACACILPCKDVDPKYLWQYMIMSYDRLRNLAQGGNQPNLNGNMIKNFPVLVPPKNLQLKFVEFTEQVDKSKETIRKILDKEQILFDSLMQQYFG